jgi:HPt (histidine-containing phosphotransfer) domain-containing protein
LSIQDLLAELQKNYLASMPDKMKTIETLMKAGKTDLLRTEFHKLKGTGRTYGLPEISQLGAAVERLCEIDRPVLSQAVPLALTLMERSRAARVKGLTPTFDIDTDYLQIMAMVEDAGRKAPRTGS